MCVCVNGCEQIAHGILQIYRNIFVHKKIEMNFSHPHVHFVVEFNNIQFILLYMTKYLKSMRTSSKILNIKQNERIQNTFKRKMKKRATM